LHPGRLTDRDTRRTFGSSSPRVMRETCIILPSGHVEIMHEQRILGSAEVASQHTSGLQTLYLHFIERVDGIFTADEVVEVEQEGLSPVCQSEDSSSYESIGSVEVASGEREQSHRDGDSRPKLHSSIQGEQSGDSMGDALGDETLVTIQSELYVMEPESVEEDAMHIMHDSPLRESQMEAHIESLMDMQLTLGSAFEEEQSDAQTPIADPYLLEMLEDDGIVM